MKRIITAAFAAAALAAPLAVPAEAAAHERDRHYSDYERDHDRDYRDRRGYREHDDWDRGYRDSDWRTDRYRRDLQRAIRRGHWNSRAFNGYTYRGQWFYGAPAAAHYDDPYYDLGYRLWRRGDRLPSYYRDRYEEVDWRDCDLRAPPRGYRYVEDDRGNYLLVAIATGVILSVILDDN
ncbi:transmembrane protein [alpha proteobacterium U9-1i]|nr:transmembrane protein [alpha proteobacterium U9-1i]